MFKFSCPALKYKFYFIDAEVIAMELSILRRNLCTPLCFLSGLLSQMLSPRGNSFYSHSLTVFLSLHFLAIPSIFFHRMQS